VCCGCGVVDVVGLGAGLSGAVFEFGGFVVWGWVCGLLFGLVVVWCCCCRG